VAIAVGDLNSAYQALKIAVAKDSHHVESLNNLGVINEFEIGKINVWIGS